MKSICPLTKQAHGLPSSQTAQTANFTGFTVKCSHCKKPQLIYAQRKMKASSMLQFKQMLNHFLYVCGTCFREYTDEPVAYSRENIHCSTPIETSYYSIESLRKVCIYCGKRRKDMMEESLEFYPQCLACTGSRVANRKRKIVTEHNLIASKKNK